MHPSGDLAPGPLSGHQLSKLETILATLDRVVQISGIEQATAAIARGFVDIGAIMCALLVREGELLRVAATWPPESTAALYREAAGGAFADFTIALSDTANPYVQILASAEPKLLAGPAEVAEHIILTYGLDPATRPRILETLHGRAGVVLPLMAGDEPVGIAGVNCREDLAATDLHLFSIFARSAGTLLNFKRDTIGREAILADLKRALASERRAREELARSERLAALGEMSAVVAHEIRNPLAVIKNSLASLRRHLPDDDEAVLLDRIADEEVGRIDRIISDMLAFSSPLDVRFETVAVDDLIGKAIFLAGEQLGKEARGKLVHQAAGEPLEVATDPHRMVHALVNLLANAHQATPPTGQVTVSARAHRGGGDPMVRIAVQDTGVGISEDLLQQIFDPFFTTKTTGVGLGLAIVKRTIDAFAGHIAVESSASGGTTITLDLPAARGRAQRDSG